MQPAHTLDPGACRRLLGLVFDVDDTITRTGKLEPEAFAALWALHRAGLRLVAVTGRPLGFAEVMARLWPIDLAVGENGAGWVQSTPAGLVAGYWDGETTREAQRERLAALARATLGALPWARLADDQWARRCDLAFDIAEHHTTDATQRERLRACIEKRGARVLESSVHMHALLGDYDKAKGTLRAIEQRLALPGGDAAERWLFVGDSGNDAAAFARFPLSVGVANVKEHLVQLPTPPAYVTTADRGRGFAELAHIVLERIA